MANGRIPDYKGTAQQLFGTEYQKVAEVALWDNGVNGKSPVLKGKVTFPDGRTLSISLWENGK